MTGSRTWIAAGALTAVIVAAYLALVPMLSSLGNGPTWPEAATGGTQPALNISVNPAEAVTSPAVVSTGTKTSGTVSVQVVGGGPVRVDRPKPAKAPRGGQTARNSGSSGNGSSNGGNSSGGAPQGGGGGDASGGTTQVSNITLGSQDSLAGNLPDVGSATVSGR